MQISAGKAKCLLLGTLPLLAHAVHAECDAGQDANGTRLGGIDRLAVYSNGACDTVRHRVHG